MSQANERSLNIKTLYQKMGQQVGQLEKENGELKAAFQVRYQINCSSVSLIPCLRARPR